MRITLKVAFIETDAADQVDGAITQCAATIDLVDDQWLHDLLERIKTRIECGVGILEHDLHVAAARAHRLDIERKNILPLKQNLAGMRFG